MAGRSAWHDELINLMMTFFPFFQYVDGKCGSRRDIMRFFGHIQGT